MKILQGVLSESKEYYLGVKKKIDKKLSDLPHGSIKEREISGKKYYYLQYRKNKKIIQKYLGKIKPEAIVKQIKYRNLLKKELIKVSEALKIIRRSEGRKRG
jgi:hypothetical protein